MPGMNGFELAQIIKERKKTAQVPIIFLTAYYSEDQHVLEGYGAGAVDYLHKPVNASILRSKVAVFAELYRKNREAVWSGNALMAEVSERRRADEQLRELNETLENRVAARTAELLESRARLRHAADLARLTYFDFDYARGRMETADNFSRIMGFALPHVSDDADAIAKGRTLLQEHVALVDRARFAAETDALEAGHVRKIEYRVLGDDGKERWIESEWHLEAGPDAAPVRIFVANLDITERKQAEEQKKLLMAEINHRSKNLLAVVQAVVTQSARGADPVTFASKLSDRLQGLSASQDLLIKSDWHGIEMSELIQAQLYHFKDLVGTRILFGGPAAHLTAAGAQAWAWRSTNWRPTPPNTVRFPQMKARFASSGRFRVMRSHCFVSGGSRRGGAGRAPTRKGFGNLVIGAIAESALGGKVVLDFPETGLVWKLSAPVADALERK